MPFPAKRVPVHMFHKCTPCTEICRNSSAVEAHSTRIGVHDIRSFSSCSQVMSSCRQTDCRCICPCRHVIPTGLESLACRVSRRMCKPCCRLCLRMSPFLCSGFCIWLVCDMIRTRMCIASCRYPLKSSWHVEPSQPSEGLVAPYHSARVNYRNAKRGRTCAHLPSYVRRVPRVL